MSRTNGTRKRQPKQSSPASLWLVPCRVEPGMFDREWLVHVTAADPKNRNKPIVVKLFADERDVTGIQGQPTRGNPVKALLRVAVANRGGGFAEVVFPQPAQPVGDSAFLDESLLEQEATA
jgi:hypothetical protein